MVCCDRQAGEDHGVRLARVVVWIDGAFVHEPRIGVRRRGVTSPEATESLEAEH